MPLRMMSSRLPNSAGGRAAPAGRCDAESIGLDDLQRVLGQRAERLRQHVRGRLAGRQPGRPARQTFSAWSRKAARQFAGHG